MTIRSTMILAIFAAVVAFQTAPAKSDVVAAITQQVNTMSAKKPGMVDSHIEITTVVQHPERVKVLGLKTPKGIKLKSKKTTSCSAKAAPGSKCKERHGFMLDANKACRLNGKYAMKVMVTCAKGAPKGTCKSRKEKDVNFSLKSENFCATKGVKVK